MTRCVCGYLMTRVGCPICDGRQIEGLEPVHTIVPRALRAFFVVPGHFESPRHYRAWVAGIPIRSERGRWKVPEKTRELIRRQYRNRCQWPSGCESEQTPTVEHIVPVAFGGSNHPGNLTLLCPTHQTASWQRFQALLSPNASQGAA
jgi:hypothetical protein